MLGDKLLGLHVKIAQEQMDSFKESMRNGEVLIGTVIETPEPDIMELMSTFGFDWFWIDMEHCPLDFKDVQTILQATGRSEAATLVRVPWNDPVYIKRTLDLGPTGVIVPWVNSQEDARKATMACMYPPDGIRGCGPRRAILNKDFTDYVTKASENVVVVVQIETKEAIGNLNGIVSVPGVDGTIVGPHGITPFHPDEFDAFRFFGWLPAFPHLFWIVRWDIDHCRRVSRNSHL